MLFAGLLFSSCEKKDSSVIDPTLNYPILVSASLNPSTVDSIVIQSVAYAHVTSTDPIDRVTATIKLIYPNMVTEGQFTLKDDGIAPDSAAGDGIYSGYIHVPMDCRLVGGHRVDFSARNISGLESSHIILILNVTNSHDQKPVLSGLVAPDSLQKPSGIGSDTVRNTSLSVQTSDPDGSCDVNGVFFNSFKPPNGLPSDGNPFTMYDDGDESHHCDQTFYDGRYSLCISITPNVQTGYYTFKFNAKDRSYLLSDTLIHLIYVYQ
jgi:hypothetical protein